jgi:lipoprotein-anchoring transpeptidase ErfK/SrfK
VQPSHPSLFANDTAGFFTAAMSAGVGAAALLVAAVSPAGASPFDLWPSARSQVQSGHAANQRVAYRSRESRESRESKEKAATKPAVDDVAAKAKGPMSVIISLDKQQLTLYSGDQPIAHSRVSTGVPGHPTPKGVFSVIQKDRWHHSNIYSNAPMYYMQRITWSGVAMHQGYVPNYAASHGCIRLPEAFAKQLWGITKLGARVIIARPELTPSAISNPKLFVFKEPPAPPKPPEVAEQPTTVGATADETVKAAFNSVNTTPAANTKANQRVTATDAPNADPVLAAAAKPLKPGPMSVFISRKEGKIFVRKGFEPVFDAPVTFAQPDQPLGTHVYTALSFNDDNSSLRWMVVTVPNAQPAAKVERRHSNRGRKTETVVTAPEPTKTSTAAEALERVTIPQDALDRIQSLMAPGASLTIADQGLGGETGKGTDFIVVTR